MPNLDRVQCKCDDRGDPLCGYCADDLYCPQCGDPVAALYSDHQFPEEPPPYKPSRKEGLPLDDDRIWVYPDEDHRFAFPLTLVFARENRRTSKRKPVLDYVKCVVTDCPGFGPGIVEIDSDNDRVVVMLEIDAEEAQEDEEWYEDEILNEGCEAKLTVVGDFGEKEFKLRVCRLPLFRVTIPGNEALPGDTLRDRDWKIWRMEKFTLNVTLGARTAPVCLRKDLDNVISDGWASLEGTVKGGTKITPSEGGELALQIACDFSEWEEGEDGERVPKELQIPLHVLDSPEFIQLSFQGVELGEPDWNGNLSLGTRYFGETIDEVYPVRNTGKAHMILLQPDVLPDPSSLDQGWIQACWAGTTEPQAQLPMGEELGLEMTIDLPVDIDAPIEASTAVVRIEDTLERRWPRRFTIDRVTTAPTFAYHLAIDFGNTNTYAALWNPGNIEPRWATIVPMLGRDDPESYPSVIFFEDSREESLNYCVGAEALRRAKRCPSALVSGLKRRIGLREDGKPHVHTGEDAQKRPFSFDIPRLVQLFLKGVADASERKLRQRIDKVALAFPTKFSNKRAKALKEIAGGVEISALGKREVSWSVALDEATAVVLGFVLDDQVGKDIDRRLSENRSLVMASLDFGGGSIDTAIIRLEFKGPKELQSISNEFLHFGGDAEFGGDTVTVVVMELLRKRLDCWLRGNSDGYQKIPVTNPDSKEGKAASEDETANFRHLWTMAELVKRHLSAVDPLQRELERAESAKALAEIEQDQTEVEQLQEEIEKLQEEVSTRRRFLEEELYPAIEENLVADYATDVGATSRQRLSEKLSVELMAKMKEEGLLMSLDEIYDHRVECDLLGLGGYSVRERITDCILDLKQAVEKLREAEKNSREAAGESQHPEESREDYIDFMVLAGASCHVPIVHDLIRTHLQHEQNDKREDKQDKSREMEIRYDPDRAKSKVAFGLVRSTYFKTRAPKLAQYSSSVDYLRSPIGYLAPTGTKLINIVDACKYVPAVRSSSFPEGWRLDNVMQDGRIIPLHRGLRLVQGNAGPGGPAAFPKHGWFDLSEVAKAPGDWPECWKKCLDDFPYEKYVPQLPGNDEDIPPDHQILIWMCNSEDDILLVVEFSKEVLVVTKESEPLFSLGPWKTEVGKEVSELRKETVRCRFGPWKMKSEDDA